MARIDVLPSIEIIRGFKGILDYYVWRGLPCVRAWPRYRPARQTDASLAAALTFGAIVKAYALLANLALLAYREDALDQPRTARDIMVTGVFGNLHEASMSDFLDALIIIRDAVVSLTDLLHALDSVDTDEIVVNVDQSVLPPLAATTTNQATQITALQKLDDLQDALESKALDRLLVRGSDQLFSIKALGFDPFLGAVSGAGGWAEVTPCLPGEIAIATTVSARSRTRADTQIEIMHHRAGVNCNLLDKLAVIAQWEWVSWSGWTLIDENSTLRAYFAASQAGDTVQIDVTSIRMTKET